MTTNTDPVLEQRARDLLAAEYERDGLEDTAEKARSGDLAIYMRAPFRAIVSALASAPPSATAAASGEAVATVIGYDPWSRVAVDWHRNNLPPGTKLYAAPQQPAGVDNEVRLPAKTLLVSACRAGRHSFTADAIEDGGEPAIPFEVAVSALDAALAAQQQEPKS